MDMMKALVEANVKALQVLDQQAHQITDSMIALDPEGTIIAQVISESEIDITQLFGIADLENAIASNVDRIVEDAAEVVGQKKKDDEQKAAKKRSAKPKQTAAVQEKFEEPVEPSAEDKEKQQRVFAVQPSSESVKIGRERRVKLLMYASEQTNPFIMADVQRDLFPDIDNTIIHSLLKDLVDLKFLQRAKMPHTGYRGTIYHYRLFDTITNRQRIREYAAATPATTE